MIDTYLLCMLPLMEQHIVANNVDITISLPSVYHTALHPILYYIILY